MADFTFAHREEGFDNHIEQSIRGYSNLLEDVVSLSRYFVEDDTNIIDIGCSTGKLTKAMMEYNSDHSPAAQYFGVEVADGFVQDLKDRRLELNTAGFNNVEFVMKDIRKFQFSNCNLITSIFTLQFMPKKDRKKVVQNIYHGLNEGGAFIFAEKTICESALVQDMITFNYYDYKRKSFDTEDIMDKERTLRNIMKPLTWKELELMVSFAGFRDSSAILEKPLFRGRLAIK